MKDFHCGSKILVDHYFSKDMKGVRTTGKRYNTAEAENIQNELYDFLKDHKRLQTLLNTIEDDQDTILKIPTKRQKKNKTWRHEFFNMSEKTMDELILTHPDLYGGIQKIYRNHGVEIPSQHAIDKNEVISAKKQLIRERFDKGVEKMPDDDN